MAKKKTKRSATAKSKTGMGGPFLVMAVFCDRILTEKDSVWSIIRIADRITIKSPLPEIPAGALQTTLAILFKAGDSIGKHQLTLVLRSPQLRKLTTVSSELDFAPAKINGPSQGCQVEVPMVIAVKELGAYVIDVMLDGKRMTRMPLLIRYEKLKKD